MSDDQSIFLNKLSLSAAILEKEGQLIASFCQLVMCIQNGLIKSNDIRTTPEYEICLRIINELYSFLQYNKFIDFKIKNDDEAKTFENIIEKYINNGNGITYPELNRLYNTIRKIISEAGYHDDQTRKHSSEFTDEE